MADDEGTNRGADILQSVERLMRAGNFFDWHWEQANHQRHHAQSEVLGTILVTAIIILLATTVGAIGATNFLTQSTSDEVLIDCTIEVTGDTVTLTHDGGDSVAVSDVTVSLRNSSASTTVPLTLSDGGSRFELGKQANLGAIAQPTTILVFTDRDVICREEVSPVTATPTPTATATPTPTPTPASDDSPTATIVSVTDNSCEFYNPNSQTCKTNSRGNTEERVEFTVEWSASDDNGLASVTIELIDSNGDVVASESPTVSGTSDSGSVTLTDSGGYGDVYTIKVTVTDTSQQSTTTSEKHTADGDNVDSPP